MSDVIVKLEDGSEHALKAEQEVPLADGGNAKASELKAGDIVTLGGVEKTVNDIQHA